MKNAPSNPKPRPFCPAPGCQKRGSRCMACRSGQKDPWARPTSPGRPKNESLALAKLMGDNKYQGGECGTCGGTERYTRNSSCVNCARTRIVDGTAARKAALSHVDAPARHCHTTSCDSEAIEGASENPNCHAVTPDSRTLGAENVGVEIGKPACTRDTPEDVADGIEENLDQDTCASGVPDACRFWCHPESGCCWATYDGDEEDTTDGLVEEITEETFLDLVKQGWTNSTPRLDSAPAPVYLRPEEIPQPWD